MKLNIGKNDAYSVFPGKTTLVTTFPISPSHLLMKSMVARFLAHVVRSVIRSTFHIAWTRLALASVQATTLFFLSPEKSLFLTKVVFPIRSSIDLDIFDYGGPRELKEFSYRCCSDYLHRHTKLRCAFRKACMYRHYIRKFLEKN